MNKSQLLGHLAQETILNTKNLLLNCDKTAHAQFKKVITHNYNQLQQIKI